MGYRSFFTGSEIDERLRAVTQKVDQSQITTVIDDSSNLPTSGAVKTYADAIDAKIAPDALADLVDQATNSNRYTDAEKTKLNILTDDFRGSFISNAHRDTSIDTSTLTGGEIVFIGNTSRFGEFQRWDGSTWNTVEFDATPPVEYDNQPVGTITDEIMSATEYAATIEVTAREPVSGVVSVESMKIVRDNPSNDAAITRFGRVNTGPSSLFSLDAVLNPDSTISYQINVLVANINILVNILCIR